MPETNINTNTQRNKESLNNILIDDNAKDKKVSILKIVLIGIIAFTIFISAVFVFKYFDSKESTTKVKINQDDIKDKLKKQMQDKKDNKDKNLFEDVDGKQNDKVSDKFRNIINNIKNDKTLENEKKKNKQIVQSKKESQENMKLDMKQKKPKMKMASDENSLMKKQESNSIDKKGFYIQVGAFYKLSPSESLLDAIKSNGFKYVLFKTKINNSFITKVVIGPYETKKDAIVDLPKVKNVESDAYILKLP